MAGSRGYMRQMSCFTLSIGLLLVVILALSSYQATAASSSTSAAESKSFGATSETRRSMIARPQGFFKKSLNDVIAFLDKIRRKILDELLKFLGLPPSGTIYDYFMKAVRWLSKKLSWFIWNTRALIDTVMNWIVDSILNPFKKALKDGMLSFRRLFRYLHRLKKGTYADFGKNNPVYTCWKETFPQCVKTANPTDEGRISTYFYCAYIFYEKCQLHYFWENGLYKVPMINGGDPCKVLPKKKCADQPPI